VRGAAIRECHCSPQREMPDIVAGVRGSDADAGVGNEKVPVAVNALAVRKPLRHSQTLWTVCGACRGGSPAI
jgi:hypothetical protein